MTMITRRAIFGMVLVAPAAAAEVIPVPEPAIDRVRASAEVLADSLKALHGGSWSIQISHETGFVAVAKDFG